MGSTSIAEDSIFAACLTELALLVHFRMVGEFAGDLADELAT